MKNVLTAIGGAIMAVALSGCIIAPPPHPRPVAIYRPAPPPPRPYYAPPPRPYYAPPPPGVSIGVHIN